MHPLPSSFPVKSSLFLFSSQSQSVAQYQYLPQPTIPPSTVHHPTVPGPAPRIPREPRLGAPENESRASYSLFLVPFPFASKSSATPSFLPCYVRTNVRETERRSRRGATVLASVGLLWRFYGASMKSSPCGGPHSPLVPRRRAGAH